MTQKRLTFKAVAVFVDLSSLYSNVYSSDIQSSREWQKKLRELSKDNKNSEYERKRLKLREYVKEVTITLENGSLKSIIGGLKHELIRYVPYAHTPPEDYRGEAKIILNNKTITK